MTYVNDEELKLIKKLIRKETFRIVKQVLRTSLYFWIPAGICMGIVFSVSDFETTLQVIGLTLLIYVVLTCTWLGAIDYREISRSNTIRQSTIDTLMFYLSPYALEQLLVVYMSYAVSYQKSRLPTLYELMSSYEAIVEQQDKRKAKECATAMYDKLESITKSDNQ